MRLDQYLAKALFISRSQAKSLIKKKLVSVSGKAITSANLKIEENDEVVVDGEIIEKPQPIYMIINKPKGYVCSHTDSDGPSLLNLLDTNNSDLVFAGRLDKDTTGLVILSDDGKWCHKITSPNSKNKAAKHYRVTLEKPISADEIALLEQGIQLTGEKKANKPCTINRLSEKELEVILEEGKYHQIKRMFHAVNNEVLELHRFKVGKLVLGDLASGETKLISPEDVFN